MSDGVKNYPFVDDAIEGYLNLIKAKKLVLFDSCHSGTAFKTFGDKPMPKSLGANAITGRIISTKAFRRQESRLNKGDYIVFSASQDNEQSLATNNGSLFTNSFYKKFSKSNGMSSTLDTLNQEISQEIISYCRQSGFKVHHPKLSASKTSLKYSTMNDFLSTKTIAQTVAVTPNKSISIMGKKTFRENEILSFKIDTHGNKGYLTIFSMENGEPFIMYQSIKAHKGILHFQEDFKIEPPIECYKSCGDCPEEVSSVYVVLSEKPITKNLMQTKGLQVSNDGKPLSTRAFRQRTHESFEPIISRVEFIIR